MYVDFNGAGFILIKSTVIFKYLDSTHARPRFTTIVVLMQNKSVISVTF